MEIARRWGFLIRLLNVFYCRFSDSLCTLCISISNSESLHALFQYHEPFYCCATGKAPLIEWTWPFKFTLDRKHHSSQREVFHLGTEPFDSSAKPFGESIQTVALSTKRPSNSRMKFRGAHHVVTHIKTTPTASFRCPQSIKPNRSKEHKSPAPACSFGFLSWDA